VKINDIIFTQGVGTDPGRIASDPYTPGVEGWKIDGDGSAEFNDVTVRGILETSSIDGDLTLNTGVLRNASGNLRVTPDGVELNPGTTLAPKGGASVYFETLTKLAYLSASTNLADTVLILYLQGGTEILIGTTAHDNAIRIQDSGGGRLELGLPTFHSLPINVTDTTESTATASGSIITAGGVGIAKNAYVGGIIRNSNTDESTSITTGSIITAGGIGIAKRAYVGGQLRVAQTTESTSTTTGSARISGGMGIAKRLNIGGAVNAPLVTVTSPETTTYNVVATDTHIAIDSSITDTINLPAGTAGRKITMFNNNVGATVTINRAGGDTINGATSITLTTAYESVTLLFSGTNWTRI
jgi:hypothetical protein